MSARASVLLQLLLPLFIVNACSQPAGPPPNEDPEVVDRLVAAAIESAKFDTDLSLSSISPVAWDSLTVFPPYADSDTARTELGFEWDLSAASPWINTEGGAVIVLVRSQQVVAWAAVPSSSVGLWCIAKGSFAAQEAVFTSFLSAGVPVVAARGDRSCLP
jgi:hypothetical protein